MADDVIWYGIATTLQGIPLITTGAEDYKANPTLASGDVQLSKDGGAFANVGTIASAAPASGRAIKQIISATEAQCAFGVIQFVDQTSPKEWADQFVRFTTKGHPSANEPGPACGLVASTTGTTTTLDTGATGTTSFHLGQRLRLLTGTGAGQSRIVTTYTSGRVCTHLAWATNPDAATVYAIEDAGVDVSAWLAAAVSTPTNAGVPNVNAKTWNDLPTVALPATPTNITAGTITTVTNLTNAPTAGDLTAAMKTSVTTAATAATPTAAAVTGAVGSVTGNVGGTVASVVGAVGSVTGNVGGNVTGSVGSVVGAVGSVTGLTAANLDTTVSSRLASASYTAAPTVAQIETRVWDTAEAESGVSMRKAVKAIAAEAAGDVTGSAAAPVFGAIGNASTPRITAAATAAGLRVNTLTLT